LAQPDLRAVLRHPIFKIKTQHLALSLAISFSLAGMALVAYATAWGPVVTSDSVYYILSADNWVKGLGFGLPWGSGRFLPYAGNPPFYPMLAAALELAGLSMIAAARWICIAAFGGTILVVGLLGRRASGSVHLALGLSLLVLTASLSMELFSRAISEPVFFLTGFSGALWFLWYLETGRLRELIPASLLISAAFLTRFPGAALALAAGLNLLLLGSNPWRVRWGHAAVFGIIIALPMLAWLGWSYTQTGEVGERVLAPLAALPEKLIEFRLRGAEIGWGWLPWLGKIPASYNTQKVVFGAGFLLFAGWTAVVLVKNWRNAALRHTNRLLLGWVIFFSLFCLLFTLVYLLGYTLTTPTPDLNERLFAPLYYAGWFTFFGVLVLSNHTWQAPRWRSSLPWIAALLFAGYHLPHTLAQAQTLHKEGAGYTGKQWRQSPLVSALRELPDGIPIITNEADAVLFLTGRPAVWLPDVIASQPAEVFTRFGDSPENLREEIAFRERGGALVLFPSIHRQLSALYGEQSEKRLQTLTNGLAVHIRYGPAEAIFFYKEHALP
jgi:hypothetical protein